VVTQEQMSAALKKADPEQRNLGQVLVSLGYASEEAIDKAVSVRLGIPYFATFAGMLEPDAAKLIPEGVARKLLLVPIFRNENTLTVGMVNPSDIDAIDEAALVSGLHVQPVMTTLANLFDSIQQVYGHKQLMPGSLGLSDAKAGAATDSVTEIVNTLFHEGLA